MASLSDKARAVFAFAAYHQLTAGETVADVVLHDGAGHAADGEAIAELESAGLIRRDQDRGEFTPEGQAVLGRVIAALRAVEA